MGTMMFCEECGASVQPGQKFCEECGSPIPEATPVTVIEGSQENNPAEYWLNVGFDRDSSKDYTGANEAYEKAISIKPGFYEALFNLGYNLLFMNRFQEAEDSFARALAIRQDDPHALKFRAFALEGLGRADEAKELMARAVKIKPDIFET